MAIIKIYLDGTKYFELDSIDRLSIKNELPLPKLNQIYSFHIFYQSQRRSYRLIDRSKYFIYRDDKERYLYEYRKKLLRIDDLYFSQNRTIKIFMRSTNDYFIYHISINQEEDNYILSEYNLSKKDINDKIFRHHVVDVISVDLEECGKIIHMDMIVNYLFKKNLIYHLRKYIYKKFHSIEFPMASH